MIRNLKTAAACLASALALSLLPFSWAASQIREAAHFRLSDEARACRSELQGARGGQRQATAARVTAVPSPVRFDESEGRGLLVRAWVNGAGPYTFAVDTGAGANLLSPRVAGEARVEVEAGGRGVEVGGLSGAATTVGQKAFPRTFALGSRENTLNARGLTIVAEGLPSDVDGILDPSEAFYPLGFVIDLPAGEISFFEARAHPLRAGDAPPGGAVVPWLTDGRSRRPFVMLGEGRRALLDTGSGFGLAVDESAARALGIIPNDVGRRGGARDIAGGEVSSQRVRAATVSVGSLVLRGVPTDLLLRAEKGAPIILGRDALHPFRITFDPASRLIAFDPRGN